MSNCRHEETFVDLVEATTRLVSAIEKMIERTAAIEKELCWHFLELAGGRLKAKAHAREWINDNLVSSKKRLNVRDLKSVCEIDLAGHLTHSDFQELLCEAGLRIDGDSVFCLIDPNPHSPAGLLLSGLLEPAERVGDL